MDLINRKQVNIFHRDKSRCGTTIVYCLGSAKKNHIGFGGIMWETGELSSINKLKSLVKDTFGKRLEINRLTELNSLKRDSDFYFYTNDMVIPIFQEQLFLGVAIVKKGIEIESQKQLALSSLVKTTLTPLLYSEFQEIHQSNFSVDSLSFALPETQQSRIISQVIHLNGVSERILKVAHQIHELENRWGFVPFKNLNVYFDNLSIQSLQEVKKLGSMTIFIPDILELSLRQQMFLAMYQKQVRDGDSPLIIVGSNLHLENLANHPGMSMEFLIALDQVTFEVNKAPMQNAQLKEATELIFYS